MVIKDSDMHVVCLTPQDDYRSLLVEIVVILALKNRVRFQWKRPTINVLPILREVIVQFRLFESACTGMGPMALDTIAPYERAFERYLRSLRDLIPVDKRDQFYRHFLQRRSPIYKMSDIPQLLEDHASVERLVEPRFGLENPEAYMAETNNRLTLQLRPRTKTNMTPH